MPFEFDDPFIAKTANVGGMDPEFMGAFSQMADEYKAKTGKPLVINDAFRTREQQAEGYRRKPNLVAPPGHSLHEKGMAMDIDEGQAADLDRLGLFEKYGFYRPMMTKAPGKKYEPWHIQLLAKAGEILGPSAAEAGQGRYVFEDEAKGKPKPQGRYVFEAEPLPEQDPYAGFGSPVYPERPTRTGKEISGTYEDWITDPRQQIPLKQRQLEADIEEGRPSADTLAQFGTKVEPKHLDQIAGVLALPLTYPIHEVGKRTIRPMLKAIASPYTTEEEIDMAEAGLESLAFLGLAPTVAKGLGYLKAAGRTGFYRYAPDFLFREGAEIGLPAAKPLTEAQMARMNELTKARLMGERATPEAPITPPATSEPMVRPAREPEVILAPEKVIPAKGEDIIPGDFIKQPGTTNVGKVVTEGSIGKGKGKIEGYRVELANGKESFIPKDEAVRLGGVRPEPTPIPAAKEPYELGSGGPGTMPFLRRTAEETAQLGRDVTQRARTLGSTIKQGAVNLWDWYAKTPEWTNFKDILGKYTGARQIANFENRQLIKRFNETVPSRVDQEAITNYVEAAGDENLLRQQTEATREPHLKRGYEAAQRLTTEQKGMAQEAIGYFDKMLQEAIANDMLESGIENFVTHVWGEGTPAGQKLLAEARSGLLNTSFNHAKHRILTDYFMGEQLGFVPKDKRIGFLIAKYHQSFYEALAARKAIRAFQDGAATDGRPLVAVSGSGKQIPLGEATEAYLIRPKTMPEETADYRYIDHPALRKWKWVSKDLAGNPIYLQGDMYVHPEIYQHLKNILGKSAIAKHPVGRGVLGTVRELKGTLLSFSGFHQMQEGLHAVFHKVNPFNAPPIDFNNPLQRKLVEHGLMVSDHSALMDFSEGVGTSGLPNKIPGIGIWLRQYQEWLFQDYIPRLKMKMAVEAYHRNVARYRHRLSDDQILEVTGKQSNAAFGELNYKMMGRNPTVQDAFRLINLAPDFLEARAKFVGQAFRPDGREQAAALLRGAIGLAAAGFLANILLSKDKKPHFEKPLTVLIGDREYSLRSVPGDLIHLVTDPRSFVYHRLNPTVARPFIEAVTGRDVFGRKRDITEQAQDFFVSHVPIPIQGKFNKSEQSLMVTALQSIGVSSWQHRTDAEKAMMDWHMQWARLNVTDPKKKEAMKYERQALEHFDKGEDDKANKLLDKAVAKGVMPESKAEAVGKKADIPKLIRSYKSITDIDEQVKIFKMANEDEKALFEPILQKRLSNLWISRGATETKKRENREHYMEIKQGFEQ